MTAPVVLTGTPSDVGPEGSRSSWMSPVMHASGLALLVLLPVEMVSWLLVPDVAAHTADSVALRWDSPAWRAVDLAFLVLGLTHGTIGAIRLIESTLRSPATRSAWVGLVLVFAVTIGALASYTLLTYEVV